jgi:predicted Zn-dependent protease/predicted Ser/Thr protein kinase
MNPLQQHVECPECHHENPAGAPQCSDCGLRFVFDDATVTSLDTGTWSRVQASGSSDFVLLGSLLADRYEILQLLGEGGMGAVYKARDRELDRLVALKVIRPELASQPQILQRFKQELILARKITHRNVIRIYDLGVADGVRFITMQFVEGRDLSSLLEEKRFTPHETVNILRQVCDALEAAHGEGVIHRDLKPHNIMLEPTGRVCVMDFGLARSVEASGLTHAGAIMGTPAYMSPEQAKGETADERSDLFSLGIIAYQMLTGKVPFKAETMLASLLLRTQGPPPPPVTVDPQVPAGLSDIILKALATRPADRYQSAAALSQDMHDWQEGAVARGIVTPRMAMMEKSQAGKWIARSIGAAVVIAAGIFGAVQLMNKLNKPAAPHGPVTLLIADLRNHTGDAVFEGTLESTLKLALEGAPFISAYDRTKMRDLGLQAVSGRLDEPAARKMAVSQGLNVVVSGSLDRKGTGYVLSLRATQAVTGNPIASAEDTASDKDQVLFTVTKVASAVRKALGDDTSESAQRFAMETLTATSLEAVHEYALAMEALSSGKNADALRSFSKAVDLDPNFGLADAGKAIASRNLGEQQDAEKFIREAIRHIDRMTERERYRTRGMFYFVTGDYQKCVEEYGVLTAKYASDVSAHNNLGICYSYLRNIPKTIEEMRRASAILPKRVLYRFNLAAFESLGGDFQAAERDARVTLQMDSSYEKGYLILAMAQLGQNQLTQAAETYHNLERVSAPGASFAASGLADLAMYEGRFSEAARILEKAAAEDLAAKRLDRAASKFAPLGYVQLLRQQKGLAVAQAENALANSKEVKIRLLAALIFVQAGKEERARELANGLASELPAEAQAYAKLIDGETALKGGNARDAIKAFNDANNLLDTWIGRFGLGRAYLDAGAFPQADSEFERCIKRRGEAILLFMDEAPTYGYFPPVYYYQGRVREGLKSSGAAESYRSYLSIRGKAGEDPLLAEIRGRIGK